VRRFLAAGRGIASAKGGPYGWDALTHLCFSKYLRLEPERSDGFVRAAQALLDAGASANTGFFDNTHQPEPAFESALYGAAGVAHHAEVTRLLMKPTLVRAVGLFGLTAIAINGVIGAGIFVMPAYVAALLGPASPLAYVLAGLAAVLIALSFAEAGSMYDRAGGPYLYAREAFGRFVGFQAGWLFLLGRVTGAAAIANAFAAYVGFERTACIAGSIAAIAALNYAGVKYGSWIVNLLTIGKLLPLAVFIAAGMAAADADAWRFAAIPEMAPLRQASLLLLFALGGFEFASVPSEEVIDPRRNLPAALIAGIASSVVIYIFIQMVCLGTLPGLAVSRRPLADAAQTFLGAGGALLMTVGAILSTTGTNSTILLIGPRMLYALAEGGQLPGFFGRVHPRFRTPHVAVVVFAGVTLAVALSGTFVQLAALNAIARLVYSITTCAAVPVLRRRVTGGFQLPGGWLLPGLGIAACLFLLTGVTRWQLLVGGVAMAIGTLVYRLRPA
jgi:amino acid transporter